MRIILASASKRRQNIFNMTGLKYEVVISDTDEISTQQQPDRYVEELSLIKAEAVRRKIDYKAIIIAADTIVYCNGRKYEKPKSREDAFAHMKELSKGVSLAYTGTTIIDMYKERTTTFSSYVKVYFKDMTDDEINWYIDNEKNIFDCSGYAVMGKASLFIDRIEGDYNTLIGISPSEVLEKLKESGYSIRELDFE